MHVKSIAEYSDFAIISTFIRLPFDIKSFVFGYFWVVVLHMLYCIPIQPSR